MTYRENLLKTGMLHKPLNHTQFDEDEENEDGWKIEGIPKKISQR